MKPFLHSVLLTVELPMLQTYLFLKRPHLDCNGFHFLVELGQVSNFFDATKHQMLAQC